MAKIANEQLRLVLVLTLIAAISGGILAIVNHFTEPRIKELERQATNEALALCLPGAGDFQKEESLPAGAGGDVSEVYHGFDNNEPAGVVVKVEPRGYGGKVTMMVGIAAQGKVAGIKVLSHSETSGLGSKITEDGFLQQEAIREGGLGKPPALKQDGGKVEAITNATISSRAVIRGINQALAVAESFFTSTPGGPGDEAEAERGDGEE
ncbi:MAG TPA: RnfABCDGE type electron transport complex subunit G [Firmicutes bacterium]|jgi:electron transport complex protein RnfG|nr:RnfABCDGE type electron transport complex subunit G [Bacillota bacterium]